MREHRSDAVALLGGAALVASAFVRWVGSGPGSTLRGHDLIDALVALGDDLPGLSATRLALVWYLVPASGAVVWIAVGLDRLRRTAAAFAVVVTLLAVAAFARLAGFADLGLGAWLATAGAATTAATTALQNRTAAATTALRNRTGVVGPRLRRGDDAD